VSIFELAFGLLADNRASCDGRCRRCGGPISVGDPVVPLESGAWHRSCVFASSEQVSAFLRARPPRKAPVPVADPRQLDLFGGKR
jgi:hypothetical protein